MTQPVAAVVLTYNSTEDLPDCLAGLVAQRGVDLRVIVVDNASRTDERAAMAAAFAKALPDGQIADADSADPAALCDAPALFLHNNENGGYSAGNNIGARMAADMGCASVLIINPDVRLDDPDYVARLSVLIHADPCRAVAVSRVRNLSGAQENPMSEPDLLTETLWPVTMLTNGLTKRLGIGQTSAAPLPDAPFVVDKVSGACFLIRTDFLSEIGFFDKSVFLYCEESILMAQVRAAGWHMMMDPTVEALHAHRTSVKGDPRPRFRAWARSRSYFHRTHGSHGPAAQALLAGSRQLTLALTHGREALKRLHSRGARP